MGDLKKICKKIESSYFKDNLSEEEKQKFYTLGSKFWHLFTLNIEMHKRQDIITALELIKKVAKKEKDTSQVLEDKLLTGLDMYTLRHTELAAKLITKRPVLNTSLIQNSDGKEKKFHEISLEIYNTVLALMKVRKKRDSYSGKRKGHAISILTMLAECYEIDNIENLYIENLKNKSLKLLYGTLESITSYYSNSEKQVNSEIVKLINRRADKAKKRSEIVGCLQTLIELKDISEMEALSRLDTWKEKHEYW